MYLSGTFNVQPIGSQCKQHETLPRDLLTYKVDILGLQETRITYQSEQKTGTYHRLTLPTSNRWHGIGFAIAPHLHRFLHKYWAQSDRVGVLQLRLPKAQRVNITSMRTHLTAATPPPRLTDSTRTSTTRYPSSRNETRRSSSATSTQKSANDETKKPLSGNGDAAGATATATFSPHFVTLTICLLRTQHSESVPATLRHGNTA
ncbi:unnamed protein product [Phytophthora fragariaefolia]|uniref:Unnamed protein product n=1 Tax=Phytophthora fragariaefolia TaxID=1490495 RepID=A0A9W6XII2_9STRA|nr:unnamed protein product [Phytophthora fragariaefolia]